MKKRFAAALIAAATMACMVLPTVAETILQKIDVYTGVTVLVDDQPLNAGDTLNVKDLTIGNGVEIIITLSNDAFMALDNTTFDIFSVQEGDVDLTGATISFTDGEQKKTGTIKAEGGKITVTDSYVVPEPTTAVLSLLALCGLAARRRRI